MSRGRTVTEYRVTYVRGEDISDERGFISSESKISRKRGSMASAQRLVLLLGPEPWLAYGKGPEDPACEHNFGPEWPYCADCDETMASASERRRKNLPPARDIKITKRTVTRGPWGPV